MERKFAAIQWMREIGALIQVNCNSVTGDNGFTTKQNVKSLLKNGLVDFVSTDAHRPEGRAPYIEKCAETLRKKYGDIYAAELTGGNARRFLK